MTSSESSLYNPFNLALPDNTSNHTSSTGTKKAEMEDEHKDLHARPPVIAVQQLTGLKFPRLSYTNLFRKNTVN